MSVGKKYISNNKSPLISEMPYSISYRHSYGEVSKFFIGLSQGKLLATVCRNGEKHRNRGDLLFLPPRADCPECLSEVNEWIDLTDAEFRVYSFTHVYFAGESFLGKVPFTLINIEVVGYDNSYSKLISTLVLDDEGEIHIDREKVKIGMKVKPKFRKVQPEKIDASALYFVPAENL